MPENDSSLHICLIAGEQSGDVLGSHLMAAIKDYFTTQKNINIHFSGVGGAAMEREGLSSLFPMSDLSVMGITEVLPRLPLLLKRIRQTSSYIVENSPDIVITIDSPDFSFRVAKKVRDAVTDAPFMVHYVAPTVWAWRPERAAKVAGLYDLLFCLFPFEPPYFEKEGLAAEFIGHPMVETADKNILPKHANNDKDSTVLGVLFGSRGGEVKRMGPVFRDTVKTLSGRHENLFILSPTFSDLQENVEALLKTTEVPYRVITTQEDKWSLFAEMDYALATSGTVGLELAVAGVPHIIGYKMNPLTWLMIRGKLTTAYAHLGNILLDAPVVPEFIQGDCQPAPLDEALEELMSKDAKQATQKPEFEKMRALLTARTDQTPSETAALCLAKHLQAAGRL